MQRNSRNLLLLAVCLGASAAVVSGFIGVYAYRLSFQSQLDALVRSNVAMAQHLAYSVQGTMPHEPTSSDPLAVIVNRWQALPRDDPSMYFCVISRDGTMLVNSMRPEKVGSNVSDVKIPPTSGRPAMTVGQLARQRGEWFGENTNASGKRQLVAYEYSQFLDGLIVVHTPASSYVAKVHKAALPWVIGNTLSNLVLWPLGLLLLSLAYDRARRRADVAEQGRGESERLFETIFEQAAIGVALIHTASGKFARINGKYESLIGYSNQEMRRKTWREITFPDDLESNEYHMALAVQGQLSEFELEKRLVRSDGKLIWVKLTVSTAWQGGENGDYHVATVEDITERRQAAAALAESEKRFRTLVEHAPEAIVVYDLDQQRFVDFNDNALRLLGISVTEIGEASYTDFLPPVQPNGQNSAIAAQEMINQAVEGTNPTVEWLLHDQHGNEIPCEVRLTQLPATGRKLLRASITDIRQRKKTEAKFRQQEAQLTHVSRLSVMGEMVAGIAHEINQPLFAITNYAHTCRRVLANQELDEPEVLEWCADMEREATRAAEIIRRLRNFTRKGGGQPRSVIDVNEAVHETIALLMLDSRPHHVGLRSVLSDKSVLIQGDLVGLQQVLVNLIRNAIESLEGSNKEDRWVTVSTEQCGLFVEVVVADNGPGFVDTQIEKSFETFYSTKSTGMGMGLSISRTIIETIGGTLTATNGAEGGAILQITLPRLERALQRDEVCTLA